jgi:hypothetical protein
VFDDAFLLKKIAQIYEEADAVFLLALDSGADLARRNRRSIR